MTLRQKLIEYADSIGSPRWTVLLAAFIYKNIGHQEVLMYRFLVVLAFVVAPCGVLGIWAGSKVLLSLAFLGLVLCVGAMMFTDYLYGSKEAAWRNSQLAEDEDEQMFARMTCADKNANHKFREVRETWTDIAGIVDKD